MMQSPQNIRVHKEQRSLELIWTENDVSIIPFRTVRQNCRCAVCVDEFTGRQLLDPESVDVDLGVLKSRCAETMPSAFAGLTIMIPDCSHGIICGQSATKWRGADEFPCHAREHSDRRPIFLEASYGPATAHPKRYLATSHDSARDYS